MDDQDYRRYLDDLTIGDGYEAVKRVAAKRGVPVSRVLNVLAVGEAQKRGLGRPDAMSPERRAAHDEAKTVLDEAHSSTKAQGITLSELIHPLALSGEIRL